MDKALYQCLLLIKQLFADDEMVSYVKSKFVEFSRVTNRDLTSIAQSLEEMGCIDNWKVLSSDGVKGIDGDYNIKQVLYLLERIDKGKIVVGDDKKEHYSDEQISEFENKANDSLYEKMKQRGRIGFFFSEYKYYREHNANVDSYKAYSLYEYATQINLNGYVKFYMQDILPYILPEGLIYYDDGNFPDSYYHEGVFVKENDVGLFEDRIEESKKYISSKRNKNSIFEIIFRFNYRSQSIFIDEDDFNVVPEMNRGFPSFEPIHGEVQELNPRYVSAALTTNLKPTKPMGAGTSAIVGKMLAGNVGAVYGYSRAKKKEKEYFDRVDEYYRREHNKYNILNSTPEYTTVEKVFYPNVVYINLPIGPIAICSYDDLYIKRHKYLESDIRKQISRVKYGRTTLEGYEKWPINKYYSFLEKAMPESSPYEIKFEEKIHYSTLKNVAVYERIGSEYDRDFYRMAEIIVTYDDHSVFSKLFIEPYMDTNHNARLYDINYNSIEFDNTGYVRYGFFDNYYCISYGGSEIYGYATQKAMDIIVLEFKKLVCDRIIEDERLDSKMQNMVMDKKGLLMNKLKSRMSL